jgi:hypothetical protein
VQRRQQTLLCRDHTITSGIRKTENQELSIDSARKRLAVCSNAFAWQSLLYSSSIRSNCKFRSCRKHNAVTPLSVLSISKRAQSISRSPFSSSIKTSNSNAALTLSTSVVLAVPVSIAIHAIISIRFVYHVWPRLSSSPLPLPLPLYPPLEPMLPPPRPLPPPPPPPPPPAFVLLLLLPPYCPPPP